MKHILALLAFVCASYGATNTNIIKTLNDASNSTQVTAFRKAYSNAYGTAPSAAVINSNYTNWMPGIGGRGGVSISSSNIYYAEWNRLGDMIYVNFRITVDVTSTDNKLVFDLPIQASSNFLSNSGNNIALGFGAATGASTGNLMIAIGDNGGAPMSLYGQAWMTVGAGTPWVVGTTHTFGTFFYRVREDL